MFCLYHCAIVWQMYLAMNTVWWVYDYPSPAPKCEWGGERASVWAWVSSWEQQGVQTVSLASVFLLLRWHREIQAVRHQAVYENTAVMILPGLFAHQPILIAMYARQINGKITTNVKKINCNSFKIIIFFLTHPVFFILMSKAKPQLDILSSLIGALGCGSQGPILSSSDIDEHNIGHFKYCYWNISDYRLLCLSIITSHGECNTHLRHFSAKNSGTSSDP